VQFQFNPDELSDRRQVTYATENTPGQILPLRQYTRGGDRTLTFTVMVAGSFAGSAAQTVELGEDGSITPELNKYRAFINPKTPRWQNAGGSFASLYTKTQAFDTPPTCLFGFGENRVIPCIVSAVTIDERLFNANLDPLRADVRLTLLELAPYGGAGTPAVGGV
jgi:hypothetical protein